MPTLSMRVLQEQINDLRNEIAVLKATSKSINLPEGLGIGDTFELVDTTWKILDITSAGYICLADSIEERQFDSDSSNWENSNLRDYLNEEFFEKIAAEIGLENIVPFERDLLSLDGQTEYGKCEDKFSLLTVDEYRKYRSLIPNTKDYWWWLISPWSTPCNDYKRTVAVVSSAGRIGNDGCYVNYGVRPFCIFSSSIFESGD
jgi:hypothetical protein|nr:MAG TPA: hypothetical protein [Caudoviricetes sp.]